LQKRKVGLALSSGAARGLAHIGVLEVLEKEGIPIDMIAGASMGALVGAVYAQGRDITQMKNLAIEWGAKRFSLLADPALPKTGLVRGRKIENMLKSIIGDVRFSDLRIPFSCVATDIITGQEVIINQGSVLEAVRASISVPIIFTAAKLKGRYLVDGGLVNPVPVSVLKDMGADFIIAVNVTPRLSEAFKQVYLEELEPEESESVKEPNIFTIAMKLIDIYGSYLVGSCLSGADVIIEPRMAGIGLGDFGRAEECILEGGLSTIDAVLEIKRGLSA